MKKLLYLFLIFISIESFAQTKEEIQLISFGPATVGSIYNKWSSSGGAGWNNMNDFGANSAGATASSGSAITTTCGTCGAGLFTDSLCLADTLRSENWHMTFGITQTSTIGSTTYGWGLTCKSVNYHAPASTSIFYNTSNTNNGHFQLFVQNNGSPGSTGWTQEWGTTTTTPVPNSTNDRIIATLGRANNVFYFSAWDQTSNSITWDTTWTYSTTGIVYPNTWVPTLYYFGGNLKVDSINIVQDDPVNPDVLFITDSKGIYSTTTWQQTYPAILGYFYPNIAEECGFGDLTSNVITAWPDVKRIMPKSVFYEIQSNDLRFLTVADTAITRANVTRFYDSCAAYGIKFIACSPLYEAAQNNSPYIYIYSAYATLPGAAYVYGYDIPQRTNGLYTDNIHLGNQSSYLLARRIREAGVLPNPNGNKAFIPGITFTYY